MSVEGVSRDPRAIHIDGWMIVNPYTSTIVAGTEVAGRPSLTLKEVEVYLASEDR
jgi:hypothetical protein